MRVLPTRRTPLLACVLGLALLAPAWGDELLTEDQAVDRALARPALTEVVEGAVETAEGDVTAARLWKNPVLSFTYEQAKSSRGGADEGIYFLQQQFEPGKRRRMRTKAARARVGVARERGAMLRIDIEAQARSRFYGVLAAQVRIASAEEWNQRMDHVAEVVELRERAGDISGYDRKRLAREQAGAEAELAAGEAAYAEARERLSGVIGRLPPVNGDGQLVVGQLLPDTLPGSLLDLLRKLEERPDVKALRKEEQAAGLEEQVARRWKVPNFTVGAGFKDVREGAGDSDGPVAYAAFPLPILNRQQAPARRARGRRLQAAASVQLLLQEARGAVRGAYLKERQLVAVAERFLREAVRPAEDLLRTAEASYKAGELGILSLLDAYRSSYEARTRYIDLSLQARQARVELERLTGGTGR